MGHVGKVAPVDLFLRDDLLERIDDLTARLNAAEQADEWVNAAPTAPAIRVELEAVIEEAQAAKEHREFRALDSLSWANLLAEHPPRREDRLAGLDYNQLTFPYAAVAACRVDRAITEAEVKQEAAEISMGQWRMQWLTVLAANLGPGEAPKSLNGSATHSDTPQASEPKPATASPAGSPEASS